MARDCRRQRLPIIVPEPSTWAMMRASVTGWGLAGYRRAETGHATLTLCRLGVSSAS